jgi:hypothetical protein
LTVDDQVLITPFLSDLRRDRDEQNRAGRPIYQFSCEEEKEG